MRKLLTPLFLAVLVLVAQAGASVVTSIPGGTVIPLPAVDYFRTGTTDRGAGRHHVEFNQRWLKLAEPQFWIRRFASGHTSSWQRPVDWRPRDDGRTE